MSGIVWLASYPKSGNTWFRVFLANLLADADTPASINDLDTPIASARELFDETVGFDASDLSLDEIDRLRPEIYCHLAGGLKEPYFMKIHDAWTLLEDGRPLIPAAATAGAIYFTRNPLDVAVSFAHHSGWDYDTAIASMADDNFTFCGTPTCLHNQFRQRLLSWSAHVLSWVDRPPFPVCVLRYEDLKASPRETFTRAVRFAGLHHSAVQIEKALAFSRFETLRRQEDAEGFREKSAATIRFFRAGQAGSWRSELNASHVKRIVSDHGEVMQRFGYLDENGEVVC